MLKKKIHAKNIICISSFVYRTLYVHLTFAIKHFTINGNVCSFYKRRKKSRVYGKYPRNGTCSASSFFSKTANILYKIQNHSRLYVVWDQIDIVYIRLTIHRYTSIYMYKVNIETLTYKINISFKINQQQKFK